jgi:hypothetical protein
MAYNLYMPPKKHFRVTQRPDGFTIDKRHPWANAAFLGLGNRPGTTQYADSGFYGNHGVLTGYSGAGDTPMDKWAFDPYLGRWALGYDITDDSVSLLPRLTRKTRWSVSAWARIPASPGNNNRGIYNEYKTTATWLRVGLLEYSTQIHAKYGDGSYTYADLIGASSLVSGTWAHVYVERNENVYSLYINGRPDCDPVTVTLNVMAPTSATIGTGTSVKPWNQQLTDVILCEKCLSPSEIACLADPTNVMLDGLIVPPRRVLWAVSTGGGAATYTGSGSLTISKASLAGTGSFAVPTYTGSGSLAVGKPTVAGIGAFAVPTYTGSGNITAQKAALAGTGTFAVTTYTGTFRIPGLSSAAVTFMLLKRRM